ncbi:hypothetical protein ACMC56_10920 [Campylobacterota bacterium DY0563]
MFNKDIYFFKSKELEEKILNIIENNKEFILHIEHDNKFYWLKRSSKSDSSLIHKLIYKTTKAKGLMPVVPSEKESVLYHEVTKLQRLKKKNINVPEVVACQKDFLVLEDKGVNLRKYIRHTQLETSKVEELIKKTVNVLAQIHNANEYHAGSQIKNYTLQDDLISAIDFEDKFSNDISLHDIQFRDFFLFLVSLSDLKKELDYKEIINIYKKLTKNETIDKELKVVANKFNFLAKIIETKFIYNKVSKDVINNYKLIRTLQEL